MFLIGLGGIIGIIVAVLVVVILIGFVISNYNGLVKLRNKVITTLFMYIIIIIHLFHHE